MKRVFDKQTLIIMVGVPGSGKSTKAQELEKEFCVKVFSSDDYRKKLLGDEGAQDRNDLVFKRLELDIRDHLSSGGSAILDATNINIKSRKRFIELARATNKKIHIKAIVVATPIFVCIDRNYSRERKVPTNVIYKYAKMFQFPMKYEGIDSIDVVTDGVDRSMVFINLLSGMMGFNQMNPHHRYTLLEHCISLAKNYDVHTEEYIAGLYHDVGKLYTQTIDSNGVAHYYNHDSIGAYLLTTYYPYLKKMVGDITHQENADDSTAHVIFFVNWHMRAHNDLLGNKAQEKYRKLFGNELFDRLLAFAEFDKIASGTYQISN